MAATSVLIFAVVAARGAVSEAGASHEMARHGRRSPYGVSCVGSISVGTVKVTQEISVSIFLYSFPIELGHPRNQTG